MSIWKYTNIIKAQKLDAEQEKPSLPSCAVLSPDSPDFSSDSVGWGVSHTVDTDFPVVWAGLESVWTGAHCSLDLPLLLASFLCVPGASAVHT